MTRITKIELEQLLAQRNNELEAARLEISRLRGQIEMAPRAATPKSDDVVATYINRDGGTHEQGAHRPQPLRAPCCGLRVSRAAKLLG